MWSINITSYEFDSYKNTSEFPGVLASAMPYISVDSSHWNSTQAVLESYNFTCTENDDWFNNYLCSYAGPCSDQVLYMPSI
jgi:hypothetical protein